MRRVEIRPFPTRSVAALLGLFLLAGPAVALDPTRRGSQYVTDLFEEELPQASVHAIYQSRDGYLWIATYRGLVRFDGVRFRLLEAPPATRLSERGVTSIAEDGAGVLYAGAAGDGLLRVKRGRLEIAPESQSLPSPFVQVLFRDRSGALWVGTKQGAAVLRGGRAEVQGKETGLWGVSIRAFAETADGILWAGLEDGRFRYLSGGVWTDAFSAEQSKKALAVTSLLAEGEGLLIGTYGGLLYRDGGGRITAYGPDEGLTNTRVRALHRDRDGKVWVGTGGGGLGRLTDGPLEMLTAENGLANDFVRSIAEDREGNLWVGTNGGLVRMEDGAFIGITRWQGLNGNFVRTVSEDAGGRILVGSDGGGLQLVSEGRVSPLPGSDALPSRFVRSLAVAPDALWVGMGDAGVVRMSGRAIRVFGLAEGLPSLATRMVLVARNGTVWAATDKGLARFEGGRFERVDGAPALEGRVVALLEGRDGTLWAGTYEQGLVGLKDGKTTVLTEKEGLAGTTVFDLREDADGTLWIGTASGLSRLKDGKLRSLSSKEGLASPTIFSILEDGLGNFWLSSDQGVMRVPRSEIEGIFSGSRTTVRCRLFGRADGLPSRQCNGDNQPAAWRSKDGRLWFATARGLAVVDPRKLTSGGIPPPVLVEGLVVDGRVVAAEGATSISPRARRLEFDFAVLSFRSPENLSVRYRLEGFDEGWREAGNGRRATYTSLPPGTYTFRVIAASADGTSNHTGASLEILVLPFVYGTWWFRASLLALGLAVGLWALRALRRWQERREEKLNRLIEEKTRDLAEAKERAEEANRRLEKMLRHDLLTDVANRLHFNEMLQTEWRRARRSGDSLAVVFFDIDYFKPFNDAFGHQAGDECLRRVAAVLADGFQRAGSLVARWGGEEFVVLLPSTDLESAARAAQRILENLDALAIPHVAPAPGQTVTISAGVAATIPGEGTAESLLAAADAALYEAKRTGRNRVVRSREPADRG